MKAERRLKAMGKDIIGWREQGREIDRRKMRAGGVCVAGTGRGMCKRAGHVASEEGGRTWHHRQPSVTDLSLSTLHRLCSSRLSPPPSMASL